MADHSSDKPKKHPPRPCPICAKMSIAKFRPFCSARCADIDLHHWLGGKYAIPTEEPPDPLSAGAEGQRLQGHEPDESV